MDFAAKMPINLASLLPFWSSLSELSEMLCLGPKSLDLSTKQNLIFNFQVVCYFFSQHRRGAPTEAVILSATWRQEDICESPAVQQRSPSMA